ncbi:MAG: cyclic nucleotide-binding domain-containing protein [Bdellovibrionota bacterium]
MSEVQGDKVTVVQFGTGEILFKEHEQSYHFFIIQEGQIEIFKTAPDGEHIPIAIVGAGTSVGEFAMIDRRPRSATARALSTVTAARVSEEAYSELLTDLPDWAVSVMRALIERLRQANEIVRLATSTSDAVKHKLDLAEFDPEAGTITETSPFLSQD